MKFVPDAPLTRGLYHKTFYGRNLFWTVVSQGVWLYDSLPPLSNICLQGWKPTVRVVPPKSSTRVGSSFACKYQTRMKQSDSDKCSSLLQYISHLIFSFILTKRSWHQNIQEFLHLKCSAPFYSGSGSSIRCSTPSYS